MKHYTASHGMWKLPPDRTLVGLSRLIYSAIGTASVPTERTIVTLGYLEGLRLKTWRGEVAGKELLKLHLGGLVQDGWVTQRGVGWCLA